MNELVEAVPNTFPALFMAYSLVWLLLSVYIYTMGRKLKRLEDAAAKTDNK